MKALLMNQPLVILVLVDAAIKSTLVLCAAFGVAFAMKRFSAAARHLVWVTAFAGLLLLPILSAALPEWRLRILPEMSQKRPTRQLAQKRVKKPDHLTTPAARKVEKEMPRKRGEEKIVNPAVSQVSAAAANHESPVSFSATFWVVLTWTLGATASMIPLLIGLFYVFRISLRAVPAGNSRIDPIIKEHNRTLSVLQCHDEHSLSVPTTWGFINPVILLPPDVNSYPTEQLRFVVLHELAHISRFDWLTQIITRGVCALYWFNPLVWVAYRSLRHESEKACDDKVLNAGCDGPEYASRLLDFVRALKAKRRFAFATVPMARRANFEARLRSILDANINRKGITLVSIAVALLLIIAVVTPLAAARVSEKTRNAAIAHSSNSVHRLNVNALPGRQLFSVLRKANKDGLIGDSRLTRTTTAAIADFIDENNALSTRGSEYGVEAICFSEILAYDGSWACNMDAPEKVVENTDHRTHYFKVPDIHSDKELDYRVCLENEGGGLKKNGIVRASREGYIVVDIPKSYKGSRVFFMRQDIVELVNLSDRPVSLKNWHVMINTGSHQVEAGAIESAVRYSEKHAGMYKDENPVIEPHGYFYLTSDRELFSIEYGDGDAVYGNSPGETIPVCELPFERFGCVYNIKDVAGSNIYLTGARWENMAMAGELVEISDEFAKPGFIAEIVDSGVSNICVRHLENNVQKGYTARIISLPRQGGFLSVTLKDNYRQVAARTAAYGSLDREEIGYSTERVDYFGCDWQKNPNPSIGGTPEKAKNRFSLATSDIKNRWLDSLEEIRNIPFCNKGIEEAIKPYLTLECTKLVASEDGVHVSGWQPAFGVSARNSGNNTLYAVNRNWEVDVWEGQTLRILSGKQKGLSFAIDGNTENSITVSGCSTETDEPLSVSEGDEFSLGPNYSTPLFYTRKNADEGIWEWKNKGLEPENYNLYIFGLNDSISVTEFLEENHNARILITAYNYQTDAFDVPVNKWLRRRYDKSDGIYCGLLTPDHISSNGGVKLRIAAYNLHDKNCSGFAWFNYAVLVPVVL